MSRRALSIAFIMALWFVISFVTNILGPIMPLVIRDFSLSLRLAGFLPFSFFLAYGVVSIPAGLLVERLGAKPSLLLALGVNLAGAALFAFAPSYTTAIAALFVIGIGMAALQVVINPLTRTVGGEQQYAFYSVMGQLVFGLASFVSPRVFTAIMDRAGAGQTGGLFRLVPHGLPWVLLYWLFMALFMGALALTTAMPLPRVELNADERVSGLAAYATLLRDPKVWGFFGGIACYVATEQSLANWMSQFLSVYHGVSPTGTGADIVGWFWGLMAAGCAAGLVLLKLLPSRVLLRAATLIAIGVLLLALFGPREVALIAFPALGFLLSVMFPVTFALALNSVREHHGAFAGILCTGIVGGAVGPLLVGVIGDLAGLRTGLLLVVGTLGNLFVLSLWARPLVDNLDVPTGATEALLV